MSDYFIRPELNGGRDDDWNRLHDAMYIKQFYRVIKIDDIWYDLPTGVYFKNSSELAENVYNQVVIVLNSIGKFNNDTHRDYELLVIGIAGGASDLDRNIDRSKRPPGV